MSTDEIKSIKEQMKDNHEEVMAVIQALKDQVKPVCDIYSYLRGFGSVVAFIAKYFVMPIIILLGAILTFKKIIK